MAEQTQAVVGGRRRRPYQSMLSAQISGRASQLPQVYRAKEQKEYQEESAGMRARELTVMEEGQKKQEEQAKRATMIGAVGTGAMIGGQTGHPYGVAIGAGIGLAAWGAGEYLDIGPFK